MVLSIVDAQCFPKYVAVVIKLRTSVADRKTPRVVT